MRRDDLVGIIDTAYILDGDEPRWLSGIGEAIARAAERGLGLVAYRYDFSVPVKPEIHPAITLGTAPAWLDAATTAHLSMPFEQRIRMYRAGACFSTSSIYASGERYVMSEE